MYITIITTIKNGSDFILETLENLKLQTYKNFEHIIVDDGSTDDTLLKIKKFKIDNPTYNLIVFNPGNLGRGKALNYAISKANYDWIAIIDADDFWHPQKLEKQVEIINNNLNIDLLSTATQLYFDSFDDLLFKKVDDIGNLTYFKIDDFFRTNHINHSSIIIKKDLCVYDENRKSQFDLELWLRLLDNKKVIAQSDLLLSFRRIHSNQSFEGKMKKLYRWRSYKLKVKYCLIYFNLFSILFNTIKLLFDLLVPRNIRFFIRNRIK